MITFRNYNIYILFCCIKMPNYYYKRKRVKKNRTFQKEMCIKKNGIKGVLDEIYRIQVCLVLMDEAQYSMLYCCHIGLVIQS